MTPSQRIAGWNVDGWHRIAPSQLDLLDAHGVELLLAQELTPASALTLEAAGWQVTTALELLPTDHVERGGRRPRFSCAVAARGPFALGDAHVLPTAASPSRVLTVTVSGPAGDLTAVSCAIPPGSIWGRTAKRAQAAALAAHFAALDGPVIVAMDRNGPRFERFDVADSVWWPGDDPSLFAPDAQHGLTDVLHALHAADPVRRAQDRAARPDGPLAVSYVERRARPPIARRYDVILASRHWEVDDVVYDHDGATAAGSDHALVVAALRSDG